MITALDIVKNEPFVTETLRELGDFHLSFEDALGCLNDFFQNSLTQSSAELNAHNISTLAWLTSIKLFPNGAYNLFVQQFIEDGKYGKFNSEFEDSNYHEALLRAYIFLSKAVMENALITNNHSDSLVKGARLLREGILDKLGNTKQSQIWMVEELQKTHLVTEALKDLGHGKVSVSDAYEKICDIFRFNLIHFSAKESLANAVTMSSLLRVKLFPNHPLSGDTLQWLKEGRFESFSSDEPEFEFAVPRGCSVFLSGAKYSDNDVLADAAEELQIYIETLGVLPHPDEVRE